MGRKEIHYTAWHTPHKGPQPPPLEKLNSPLNQPEAKANHIERKKRKGLVAELYFLYAPLKQSPFSALTLWS